ncbi:MAG TPA: DUF4011 domain-containing protein [Ktedonobacterales bacterium]|nr:DUF4011 domain-containing protein [Ktedonobacterales bacterium]
MSLDTKLQVWQNDLLDLSRRNNLLYFGASIRSGSVALRVEPGPLFARLAGSRDRPFRIPLEQTGDPEDPEATERRLVRLRARARDALNDRGTHVLYLAFGILAWKESDASDELIRSPLVLVPVELKREGALGAFQLLRASEEIEINPTLTEKFKHDFGIELPTYAVICEQLAAGANGTAGANGSSRTPGASTSRASDAAPPLDAVLDAFGAVLRAGGKPAEIAPDVHLGIFSFQKLVMYQDLKRNADALKGHPIIRKLGGESIRLPAPGAELGPGELDRHLRPQETLEILDADSSQQEAILAAKRGASFVLQGPPGTGKSQTIGNIIAECLGQGKSVLFVSEKRAALEVVSQRLHAAGLGEFCLELHSHNADKKQLVAELERTLREAEQASAGGVRRAGEWESISGDVADGREKLNAYVHELHLPRLALGRSAFDVYGALARLAQTPDLAVPLADVAQATQADLTRRREALERLLLYTDVLDASDGYPWRETLATEYTLQLGADIGHHFGRLRDTLGTLAAREEELAALLAEQPPASTFDWLEVALQRAEALGASPAPPEDWLWGERRVAAGALAEEARDHSGRYTAARTAFEARYAPGALALDHAALLRALDDDARPAMDAIRPGHHAPQDVCLAERDRLDAMLNRATALLPELVEAAGRVTATCRLTEIASLAEVEALLETVEWILTTPTPPPSWLSAESYPEARALTFDARARYTLAAQQRETFATRYTEALDALDIPALAARFRKDYAAPLCWLMPGYWSDLKRMRGCLRPGVTRSPTELRADVLLADQLRAAEAELDRLRADHARALGAFFAGSETDWERVVRTATWADRRATHYPEGLPREVERLVCGPARGLQGLRRQHERLRELWGAWLDVAAELDDLLLPEMIVPGHYDFADEQPAALAAVLAALHAALMRFWQAVDTLLALAHDRAAVAGSGWAALCDDLRHAMEAIGAEGWLAAHGAELAAALGRLHHGLATDWPAVFDALDWSERFCALYGALPVPDAMRKLASDAGAPEERARIAELARACRADRAAIEEELAFADSVLPRRALLAPAAALESASMADVRACVARHLDDLPCLERWLECRRAEQACDALGLGPCIEAARGQSPFPRDLPDRYEKRFYQLWLDDVLHQTPALAAFRGETHEQVIGRFRRHDQHHIELARVRLRDLLGERRREALVDAQRDTMAPLSWALRALRKEVNKKRHGTIRNIVNDTGAALIRFKPCWMMSPLSVSQFLKTGERMFDVVVFDEASQVCPEDALCAIFRGAQLIVVGDSKQLPPTRFFSKTLADLDSDADEDDENAAEDARNESILDACDAAFDGASRMLRWHYRSRHESLIAFSNAHFYDNRLETFPGPQAEHAAGVQLVLVENGVYDRGRSRTNRAEAERAVDLAIEHLRRRADGSVGIVALSEAQQQAIRDVIERRLKQDAALRAELGQQLDESDEHGFFVKNLESVQGDERDAIILSVGYARDANGRMYYNFGPVNRPRGERRLNVAVTRAREQLVLVASIRASDLPADLPSPGARILRAYLEYAELGPDVLARQVAASAPAVRGGFDSPFEKAVHDALTARGLTLACQVGCSGYYIDLAVRDPHQPGRYLLGIECDGATYHSAKTARDRDRLRQRHLERLGWHIHRIWSRDWVRDQSGEVQKVLRAVADLQQQQQQGAAAPVAITVPATAPAASGPAQVAATPSTALPGAPRLAPTMPSTPTVPIRRASPTQPTARRTPPPDSATPAHSSREQTGPATAVHICEACAFYQFHTAKRFYCGHDAAYKLRDASGRTPGCPAWHRRA